MPLKAPSRPAADEQTGDLISWSEEWKVQAAAGAVVVLHVREQLADDDQGNGPYARFSVDALFATGPRKGQVHHDVWVTGKGMTGPLKREAIGAEPVYRLALGKNGTTKYAQANDPSDEDMRAAEAVYREGWFAESGGKAATYSGGQAADATDAPF